jgi:hypothetical protein
MLLTLAISAHGWTTEGHSRIEQRKVVDCESNRVEGYVEIRGGLTSLTEGR